MSSFTKASFNQLDTTTRDGRPLFQVSPGFSFYIGAPTSGLCVIVPEDFITDLVSDPTGFYTWLWHRGWFRRQLISLGLCAIVHDRLREDLNFTKPSCDLIFMDALCARKVWPPLAWVMFWAVWTNNSRVRHNP